MNVATFLERSARLYPDRPAVSLGKSIWLDYRGLMRRASTMAASLRDVLKLVPGDRVALAMTNCPQVLEIKYAAWIAGLIVVPINSKLHPREFEFILEDSGARVCFVTADLAPGIEPLCATLQSLHRVIDVSNQEYRALCEGARSISVHDAAPDDVAWLFYTSGTTGRPKGVMITHHNEIAMAIAYFAAVETFGQHDVLLHAAPMSHGSGQYNFPITLAGGNQVIPESGHFEPDEIFQLCAKWRNVTFFAAPTMVHRLVVYARTHSPALDGLRTIVYAGGPMYLQDIKNALSVMGPRFAQIYGQGEAPMCITALSKQHINNAEHPRYEQRLASVGVAQPCVEVRVADENDAFLPDGRLGEVLVRGDSVMRGYWRNQAATAETLRNGWLHTGDVGAFDSDGFLTLHDRSKDLIISGGTNIYPREIEEVLLRHPAVSEASVVGRPHPDWGEEVVAFVVLREGLVATDSDLDALCLENIARFKRPKAYRFVASLPKNHYGKVLKTELRALVS